MTLPVQKDRARPETIDLLTLAYYEQVLTQAKVKPRDPIIEALMGNYETMMRALKARIQPDRAQLLDVAGGVAGSLATYQPDDKVVAKRAVSIARDIVGLVDEAGQ